MAFAFEEPARSVPGFGRRGVFGRGALLGGVALVIHLRGHWITRMPVGVLVDRPGSEEQRTREHTRDDGCTPTLLVRIV